MQRGTGQLDHRQLRGVGQQVADGVRLAGPRRSVEEQTALEVLSAGQQRGSMPSHSDDLALHRVQHARREHQRRTVKLRSAVEVEQRLSRVEDLAAERQDLATEHVVFQCRRPDGCPHGGRTTGLGADDLQRDSLVHPVGLRATEEQGDASLAVMDQVERARDARPHRPVGTTRDVHRRDMARSGTPGLVMRRRGQQVGQPELPVLEASHSDDLVFTARLAEPGVEADLCVHVVVRAPGLLDDRDIRRHRPQVLDQPPVQGRRKIHSGSPHKAPHRPASEPGHIGELRSATSEPSSPGSPPGASVTLPVRECAAQPPCTAP